MRACNESEEGRPHKFEQSKERRGGLSCNRGGVARDVAVARRLDRGVNWWGGFCLIASGWGFGRFAEYSN